MPLCFPRFLPAVCCRFAFFSAALFALATAGAHPAHAQTSDALPASPQPVAPASESAGAAAAFPAPPWRAADNSSPLAQVWAASSALAAADEPPAAGPAPTPGVPLHTTPTQGAEYPYQWRGLIWQTVEFDIVELTFRSTSDNVLRDLLIHKPFWHDWIASMHQWNMGRWSDGDDFLVDDVGHPMQGAVSGMIEIQNSPKDARIEWGDDGYWASRFRAFLWATAFSTQQKVSPIGEAGIGNDGGFTYGNQCLYHCSETGFPPGSKYTNNTGWTDLVITPTVGTAWIIAEDVLDKDISDRLVAAFPDKLWPRIVRGGLNPARSFAEMIRWQVPWYRDFEQPLTPQNRVHWFPSDEVEDAHRLAHYQIAPFLDAPSLAANTAQCFNYRQFALGGGVQTVTQINGWLSFDAAVSYHANASPLPSDRAGGNMTEAVFGLGWSRNWRYWGLHAALRPGLVRYSNAYLTSPVSVTIYTDPPGIGTLSADPASHQGPGVVDANGTPNEPALGDINHFVWNATVSADYRINRFFGIRFGLNDNIIRYRTDKVDPPGIGTPPYLSWLSKQAFINRGNVGYQLGPVFSF